MSIYSSPYRTTKVIHSIKEKQRKIRVLEKLRSKKSNKKQIQSNSKLKKKHRLSLHLFADRLNETLPKSELWFHSRWKELGMDSPEEIKNEPFFEKYIPDILCEKYRYVIEIDGSIHDLKDQKKKDRQKDTFYESRGFEVFRVRAFNNEDILALVELVERKRDSERRVNGTTFLLRKNGITKKVFKPQENT